MVSTEIIIPPRQPLRVLGGRHPLTNDHRTVEVPAGATIAEALELVIVGTGLDWPKERFVATVNDVRVPRDYWQRVRPKPGTVVVFRPVAAGDNTLRTVLFLAVAVAALFIAPFIAGPAVLGLTGAAFTAGVTLIGGAITLAGAFLLNALIPIRPPQQDTGQPKTLPMISGASNEVRPWGPIPVVLGTHRISPMFAAMPFSSFQGKDQYIQLFYCCGYGALQINPDLFKIGDTRVAPTADSGQIGKSATFDDFDYAIQEGHPGSDNRVDLFKNIVNEFPLGLLLKSVDGYSAPYSTGPNCARISIDVIAPGGIFEYNNGVYADHRVVVNVQYRQRGDPTWRDRPNIIFTRSRDPQRLGQGWDVAPLPPATYEVRLRKATADYTGTGQVADSIVWQTLRAFENGNPIHPSFRPRLALVAIKARATDQFNGVISTFNCVVSSYVYTVRSWNGTAFTIKQVSNNPADLFLHVLTGPANARPRTPAQIDIAGLQLWAADCDAFGYTYNAVVSDARSVREVLADIAAAGRATVALRNGKWGVSFPRPSDPVSWHFTPRNSSGLKTTRAYQQAPHAFRVRWINRFQNSYRQEEGIVYNDKTDGSDAIHDASSATLFETVEFPGVTEWAHIVKAARYQMAQALLRPETHTLTADIESLRLERGDKVALSSDTLLIGLGYGRVTKVDAAANTVTVDSRVIMEQGETYSARFSLDHVVTGTDGPNQIVRRVINTANETDLLHFDNTDGLTSLPQVGNLFSFGKLDHVTNLYRVLDIRPGSDLSAQVMLVDDADKIDEAQGKPIPEYQADVTLPPDPYELPPEDLTFTERFSGSGITAKSTVYLTVIIPRVGTISSFEYQSRDVDTDGLWTPFAVVSAPLLFAERDNLEAGSWQFRVRALFRPDVGQTASASSKWVMTKPEIVSVIGLLAPPPDVTGELRINIAGPSMILEWDPVAAPNFANYLVKYSPATDGTATWSSATELMLTNTNRVVTPTLSGTFFVKAMSYSDIESVNAIGEILFTGASASINVVETLNEGGDWTRTDGTVVAAASPLFAGTHSSTTVDGSLLTLTRSGPQYVTVPGLYQFLRAIDLGATYTSRITAYVGASGISSGDTMDHWVSLATVTALDTSSPSDWKVEPVYRASIGPFSKTIKQIITEAGLNSNLRLLLEAGTVESWPGSGQKWLDESGGGYDFFLGVDGTVAANDPTFVGAAGNPISFTNYWRVDGGDFFTYDAASEVWMDAIHKDNARFTAVVVFSRPSLDTSGVAYNLLGNSNSQTQIGFQFTIVNNQVRITITKGTTGVAYQATGLTITATGWHVAGVSIDEAVGTGTLMLDGAVLPLTAVAYTSPSAAAASNKLNIAAYGSGNGILPANWFIHSVSMWQGVALSATQLATLGNTLYFNDRYDYGPWTQYSVTDVTARAFYFGVRLIGSADGTVSPAISDLAVTIDMPDRHLGFDNVQSGTAAGGKVIEFKPPFKSLKSIALANYALAIDEKYTISALPGDPDKLTGVSILFTSASLAGPQDRKFSLHAYGYGVKV